MVELESTCNTQRRQLAQLEETLGQERLKVQQLEAELATVDIVKEGLGNELDKVSIYCLSKIKFACLPTLHVDQKDAIIYYSHYVLCDISAQSVLQEAG